MTARLRVAASVTVAGLLALAAPATAAESVSTGWWSAAPLAPDAPDNGIVVQGGADPGDPIAYGALAFELAPGETPVTVRVSVAPDTASTPATLALCPLVDTFSPAKGGSMDDAPAFDCAARVTAAPGADGATYEFDLSALGQTVASFAVLPTAATDRVVLSAPTTDSLTTKSSGPTATTETATSFDESSSFAVSDVPATSFDIPRPFAPAASDLASAAPTVPVAPSPATRVAATQPLASQAAGDDDGSSKLPAIMFAGLTLAAVGLWAGAGRDRGDEVGLVLD